MIKVTIAVGGRCGKVPVTLLTRAADIGLLVLMAFLPTSAGPLIGVLLAAHLVRKACANCTRPLMRSILMEHVPKRHRGKVNALDSIRTFSWSGSSAAGGCALSVSLSLGLVKPAQVPRRCGCR